LVFVVFQESGGDDESPFLFVGFGVIFLFVFLLLVLLACCLPAAALKW